ncbi:Fc receptor-like protein 5 [Salminus brasiliensis]|uniref:Fc receptor-like protein 5 n=1 Tax=Salminus brasiliensis TaxID=930266 RepID=UPI003B83889C
MSVFIPSSSENITEIPTPTLRVDPHTTVYTGDTLTLTCDLQISLTGWRFRWYKVSQQLNPLTEYKDTNTLSITVSDTGTAEYQCVALRGDYVSHYSAPVKITVRERPKPTVKVQPAERVFIRERVTLTCDIESGGDWSYEWFKNNDPLSEAQWRKNYEISNVDGSHEGDYTCKGRRSTEPHYSEISAAVRLTVSDVAVAVGSAVMEDSAVLSVVVVNSSDVAVVKKPTLRVYPHTTVYTGDTLTLTCDLQSSLAGWKFTWFKVSQQLECLRELGPNTLSITASDSGTTEYQCQAFRGSYDSYPSNRVKITVREKPKPTQRVDPHTTVKTTVRERPKATVKVQPAERVFIRERVTLTCDIESGGVWNYEWFKNNDPLSEAQWRKNYEISDVDGSHEGDYTCKGRRSTEPRYSEISAAVRLTVSGDYTCKGRRSTEPRYSEISAAVRLTVSERPKATVKVQPAERVFIRERVTLTCDIESGGVWNYEWFKNNDPLSEAQWRKNYEISNADGSHEGDYTCKGRRSTEPSYSEISAAVRLTVSERPKATVKVQPAERVFIRERVTLTCDIESGGVWNYEWFKNNDPLSEAQWRKNYEISNADGSHEGDYTCKGRRSTEPSYSEISAAVRLTVSDDPVTQLSGVTYCEILKNVNQHSKERPKATVKVQPAERVFIRQRVTLTCDIESGGVWSYEWFKNNDPLSEAQWRKNYEISNADGSHEGDYTCKGRRSTEPRYSEISAAVRLTVSERPKATVKVQPAERVFIRQRVTLTCDIESGGVWNYEWFKNNDPLSEAQWRKNYEISNADGSHEGDYTCKGRRSTEPRYSEISAAVRLTVSERPKATVKVQPAERVFIRQRVTLTCDIESGGVWNYEWFKNNDPLSEAQWRKNYEISNADGSHEGDYTCKGRRSTEPRFSEISAAVRLTVSEKPTPTRRVYPHTTVKTTVRVTANGKPVNVSGLVCVSD